MHKTHRVDYRHQGQFWWQARCTCGQRSEEGLRTKQMAEDWWTGHQADVARLKAKIRPNTQTLDGAYAYYREMADNPNIDAHDREQWKQLADEAGRRLGHDAPPSKQEELFTL